MHNWLSTAYLHIDGFNISEGVQESRMPGSEFQPLETARTKLVLPDLAYAPRILRYYEENKQHFAPWDPVRPDQYYTEEFWLSEITKIQDEFLNGRSIRLVLLDRSDPAETILGQCSLTNIVRGPFEACHLGYGLHHQAVGKGLMFEALNTLISCAFNDLRLHRIMANYMPTNERSARLLRRLGFVVEGYARDYLFLAGKWQDHILTSLINPSSRSNEH
jgi:[ribosomal protein S5]-alanine N-acetyltransferase